MIIRPWKDADREVLREMLREYLLEQLQHGGEYLPTERNIDTFLHLGFRQGQQGDPVLVAVEDDVPVGFLLASGMNDELFDTSRRRLMGLGTYVVPALRRQGIASHLRRVAFEIARQRGYETCEGIAHDTNGAAAGIKVGGRVVGILVRKELN